MKTATIILKILAAIAAVAGVVYLVATYGDKVVAFFKRLLGKDEFECCENCECDCDCDECDCEGDCETCQCGCEVEEAVEEAAEEEPTATEEDFAE